MARFCGVLLGPELLGAERWVSTIDIVTVPPSRGSLDLSLLGICEGAGADRLESHFISGSALINIKVAYIQYDAFKVFLSGNICIVR